MADNIEEEVLEFVTDTVAEYTNHGRSGDESRLFSIMVRLATCLLAINVLLSGVASLSNEQEVLFVSLFSTLSGLYMVVDDRLGVVCRGGDDLVQIRRGRPRIERLQLRHGYDVIRTSVWQKLHSGSMATYRKLLLQAC